MSTKLTQIFNKLFPPTACQHLKWIDVGEVHLSKLLPDIIDLQDYSIFISGINARECVVCHMISSVAEEADRLVSLKEMAGNLMKLYKPSERITLSFGDIVIKRENQVRKKKEPPLLVEEAIFTAEAPRFGMESVILNESTRNHLEEALLKIEGADDLYSENGIGYGKIRPYNQATIILCYGPPGTGKTMAAQAIASYRNSSFIDVNLADIESRFMSQTSKNISKAFKMAIEKNAVLFFDEADTMLGTRLSEVSHGVEAEINMSRSTMLKELERFQGVCLFATNFESNIDRAFVRRITHHIEFGLPEHDTRRRFWEYCLLEKFKLEDTNRANLIEKLTSWSDQLSGADIVRVLELAYFKAYRHDKLNPLITNSILQESIAQIKKANDTIGKKKQNHKADRSGTISMIDGKTFAVEDYAASDPRIQLTRIMMGLAPSDTATNRDEKAGLE